jgi:parvulin-like peptidyl-prolyl isomerase
MNKPKFSLIALALAAILVLGLTGCGGRRTVVKINGEKFTKNDFYNRLQKVPVQTPQGLQPAGRYVMQQMISEKLVQQLAKKEGVEPTEAQINRKIDYIKKESGANFSKVLAQRGMTLEDLKHQISVEQSFINVVTKGIKIPDDKVKKAYEDILRKPGNPFVRPEGVMARGIIVAKKADVDKAYNLLQSGTDFGTVAMRFNDDPMIKQNQGRLRWITKEEQDPLPKIIKTTAFSLAPGKYSKPFLVEGRWVILKAESRRPKRITPFSEVKEIIREQLAMSEGTKKGTFTKAMQKFAKEADIWISHPAYKDIAETIKKEAAKAAPTAATPTAGGGATQPTAQ